MLCHSLSMLYQITNGVSFVRSVVYPHRSGALGEGRGGERGREGGGGRKREGEGRKSGALGEGRGGERA